MVSVEGVVSGCFNKKSQKMSRRATKPQNTVSVSAPQQPAVVEPQAPRPSLANLPRLVPKAVSGPYGAPRALKEFEVDVNLQRLRDVTDSSTRVQLSSMLSNKPEDDDWVITLILKLVGGEKARAWIARALANGFQQQLQSVGPDLFFGPQTFDFNHSCTPSKSKRTYAWYTRAATRDDATAFFTQATTLSTLVTTAFPRLIDFPQEEGASVQFERTVAPSNDAFSVPLLFRVYMPGSRGTDWDSLGRRG